MPRPELDVLVVGAGLSGIAMARYLTVLRPQTSFTVLEARERLGGTWDLFRYPGARSDSDLHTYAYAFKPWPQRRHGAGVAAFASRADVLDYLHDTVQEYGLDDHIRYGHRVVAAHWDSATALWQVEVEQTDSDATGGDRTDTDTDTDVNHPAGRRSTITCRWLFVAGGYYRYDRGHWPPLPDLERFTGQVVHQQAWPDALDVTGRRVVVLGSGATAVTMAPALVGLGAKVTVLQRSPGYIISLPSTDLVGAVLPRLFGHRRGHRALRAFGIARAWLGWTFCQRVPQLARRVMLQAMRFQLPRGFDTRRHANPDYLPWRQRVCVAPDGDYFAAIRRGEITVVTDEAAALTETGLRLRSGRTLPAEVLVLATGLELLPFGGIELQVDGRRIDPAQTVVFRGLQLSGVPNFGFALGYVNASWTLRIDLICEHFCRLLDHLDEHGHLTCTPVRGDPDAPTSRLLGLQSGYITRSADRLPKQGEGAWRLPLSYLDDVRLLRRSPIEHPDLRYSAPAGQPARPGSGRG